MNRWNFRIFDDPNPGDGQGGQPGGGQGGQPGGQGGATYDYAQLEEIANARATRAEHSALSNYFRQQGMSQQEVEQAINEFRQQRANNTPNVDQLTRENNDLKAQIELRDHTDFLRSKGVKAEDIDYVLFKISQNVSKDKDFKTAAEEWLKGNTRFTSGGYRMSSGGSAGGSGAAENRNGDINAVLRAAFGR